MSARKARTEAAAAGAAPVDSEEKDVKIPVEAVDDTEANEAEAAEAVQASYYNAGSGRGFQQGGDDDRGRDGGSRYPRR